MSLWREGKKMATESWSSGVEEKTKLHKQFILNRMNVPLNPTSES